MERWQRTVPRVWIKTVAAEESRAYLRDGSNHGPDSAETVGSEAVEENAEMHMGIGDAEPQTPKLASHCWRFKSTGVKSVKKCLYKMNLAVWMIWLLQISERESEYQENN